jgi:hypothetical protein
LSGKHTAVRSYSLDLPKCQQWTFSFKPSTSRHAIRTKTLVPGAWCAAPAKGIFHLTLRVSPTAQLPWF